MYSKDNYSWLGVHISKVRSIVLDDIDSETQSLLLALGNRVVNSIYEANYDPQNENMKAVWNSDS